MIAKSLILGCLLTGVITLGVSSAWAQAVPSAPEELVPGPDDTIQMFIEKAQRVAEDRAKKGGEEAQKTQEQAKQAVESSTAKAIAQKPTTAAPAPAFADRVNTAIADFLPWFQFAVNEVASSEDKMSVTAKFNPIPVGTYGNVSVTATAAQPQVFKALEQMIVEPAREAQRKSLLGKVDDFSDLTIALSYGLQWRAGTWDNTRKLFGRNYELYRNLASELLREALTVPLESVDQATDRVGRARLQIFTEHKSLLESAAVKDGLARNDFGNIRLATLKSLAPEVHAQLVDVLRQQAELSADVTAKVLTALQDNKLDALPAMIDNQPQIVVQGSYRASDEIIGRDTMAITANYEMGSRNFNAVLREYHQMQREGSSPPSYLEAFRRGVTNRSYRNEDKAIFSVSFRRNERYSFTHGYKESVSVPGSTTPVEIDRTAVLNLPRSDDWRASLSWTRLWPRRVEKPGTFLSELPAGLPQLPQVTGRQDPRTTLSIEWVDADQKIKLNGKPLENDRFVARLSLVVPVQGGMTLPLTIVYSNNPEFLKDQDRVLSAHVGISYKIGEKGPASGQ
jgi:hypothetical protein